MAYIPEVGTGRIEDGGVEFVDLSPSLQAMISATTPVGAAIVYEGFGLPAGWLWEDGDLAVSEEARNATIDAARAAIYELEGDDVDTALAAAEGS